MTVPIMPGSDDDFKFLEDSLHPRKQMAERRALQRIKDDLAGLEDIERDRDKWCDLVTVLRAELDELRRNQTEAERGL